MATRADFPALGTTASVVVTEPGALEGARAAVEREIESIDRACSRFRDDSELTEVNRAEGRITPISAVLMDALEVALQAARSTDGLVDPTVGSALRALGYDRTFVDVARSGGALPVGAGPVAGWRSVELDRIRSTVCAPEGVELDLGATAKALCADRAAVAAARVSGVGVIVSLGGDMAAAGTAPEGGWAVLVTDDHAAGIGSVGPMPGIDPVRSEPAGQVVALLEGGLATSGTAVRRWSRGSQELHHLIDPRTGASTAPVWRTVSVAAGTCVEANTATTAAMILGDAALNWLASRDLAARLVAPDGAVVLVGDWPASEPR